MNLELNQRENSFMTFWRQRFEPIGRQSQQLI
jgi:hypothetical protein